MNPDYLIALFDYDTAASRDLLSVLKDSPSSDERRASIFAHVLAARKVWMERLTGGGRSSLPVWPALNFDECATLIEENNRSYNLYLRERSEGDLKQPISYQNSKGTHFSERPRDILMHVLIHGGYHRGQIAQSVRGAGEEPINTDYITHLRNR